jgi:hypothetical protein
MPEVSASAMPWTMNSTPMNVARLRTVRWAQCRGRRT